MHGAEHKTTKPHLDRFPRRNDSVPDAASWLVALLLLALVTVVNEVISRNTFFLSVHDTTPLIWLAAEAFALGLMWVVLVGLLRTARRFGSRAFDCTATALMLVVGWLVFGNVIVRTMVPDEPEAGTVLLLWLAGLPVAVVVALLARRIRMGSALLCFGAIAAVMPLAPAVAAPTSAAGSLEFDDRPERPSVLWIVADELQYQLAFDETGHVRPQFSALRRLQEGATTYLRAFSPANGTALAIPAMMTGIGDVTQLGRDDFDVLRDRDGLLPQFDAAFTMAWSSPLFGPRCTNEGCDARSSGVVAKAARLLRDTAAVVGSTALAPPLRDLTPPITGKWRDFDGDSGREAWPEIAPQLASVLDRDTATPFFAFWHDMDTHVPWFMDSSGNTIYPPGLADIDAVDVGYTRGGDVTTQELTILQRRLYAAGAANLDRRIGALLTELEGRGLLDGTLVVITADHGAAVGLPRRENSGGTDERRLGATPAQAWGEIAHVPLLVKYPGQRASEVVTQPRSTAQILPTVLDAVGGTATTTWAMMPSLASNLPDAPVFIQDDGSSMTRIPYVPITGASLPEDAELTPVDGRYPFAVGTPASILGAPVPDGWDAIQPEDVNAPDGSSENRLLLVTRAARACAAADTVGLVSVDGLVVGSVLWEQDGNNFASTVRGWSIVPTTATDRYRFWCRAP